MYNGIYFFDIFVLIILAFGVLSGLFRGLIKEIGSIIGLLLAFIFTLKSGNYVASVISKHALLNSYAEFAPVITVVTYVILFLVILFVVNIAVSVLQRVFIRTNSKLIKWGNRLLGMVGGLIKGFIVALIIYFLLITFADFLDNYVVKSRSAAYFDGRARKMQVFVSDTLKNQFFYDLLHPKPKEILDVPPPPTEGPGSASGSQSPSSNMQQPMYVPEDNTDLFNIESFE